MLLVLILLMLGFQQTANGQPYSEVAYTFRDGFTHRGIRMSFNPGNGDIYLLNQRDNTLARITEAGTVDTLATLQFEDDSAKIMETGLNGEKIFFWDTGIGRVHEFDINSRRLGRVDTSFNHKNMFGHAATLSENNYIYAIGGYGLWLYKNLLIRYEQDTGQWEKVSVKNRQIVNKSMRGLLYRTESEFYYLGSPADHAGSTPLIYRLNQEEKVWQMNNSLTALLNGIYLGISPKHTRVTQTATYKVDTSSNIFGFLSNEGESNYINLVNYKDEKLHRIRVSALGLVDPRVLYFSERTGRWIIAGHEPPWDSRNTLLIKTFKFDPNLPFVETITKPGRFDSIYSYAGFFLLLLAGFAGWRFLRNGKDENRPGRVEEYSVIINISDPEPAITINGYTFNSTGDKQLEKLWEIITDMVLSDQKEILASSVDQQLYSSQTHQSYISRNRKKLIELINEECGIQLIREGKSKVDKRFKVLSIDLDKIKIIR